MLRNAQAVDIVATCRPMLVGMSLILLSDRGIHIPLRHVPVLQVSKIVTRFVETMQKILLLTFVFVILLILTGCICDRTVVSTRDHSVTNLFRFNRSFGCLSWKTVREVPIETMWRPNATEGGLRGICGRAVVSLNLTFSLLLCVTLEI